MFRYIQRRRKKMELRSDFSCTNVTAQKKKRVFFNDAKCLHEEDDLWMSRLPFKDLIDCRVCGEF